jgi:hypothetical protein
MHHNTNNPPLAAVGNSGSTAKASINCVHDNMAPVEEEANHLPTPPAQYGPGAASRSHTRAKVTNVTLARVVFQTATAQPQRGRLATREHGLGVKAPSLSIPVGARCTNAIIQLPAAVEAAEERPPLAPLQQIHERTHIINPLKRRREEPDT